MYWLKMRQSSKWGNRQKHNVDRSDHTRVSRNQGVDIVIEEYHKLALPVGYRMAIVGTEELCQSTERAYTT
jgi:hypothetical protein